MTQARPDDGPRGWVEQGYLPDQLAGTRYYQPSQHGHEAGVAERLLGHRSPDQHDSQSG